MPGKQFKLSIVSHLEYVGNLHTQHLFLSPFTFLK